MLRRLWAWEHMEPVNIPPDYLPETKISVIIPIRNEGPQIAQLLQDLNAQTYPPHLFEVLVINDHSDDDSLAVVNSLLHQVAYPLRCLSLAEQTGKKAAVALGVTAATGELLAFTDGDCRVQPAWLACLAYYYTSQQAKFISGPVLYEPTPTLFEKIQLVEFASLIGTGGSSIALGQPNMCNGANLAYPKSVFAEVNGFSGNEHLPSGDDEFLMHKVHQRYPGSVCFIKAAGATVFTRARPTLAEFFAQRVRWASKWSAYQSWRVKLLALLVFGVNFLLFLGMILVVAGKFSVGLLVVALTIKIMIDFSFLKAVLRFFNKLNYLYIIIPLQIIYVPYVVITALVALRGSYSWKGRKIKP
ncbi:glycosyl transferase [Adhaeribacter aerolatus]|uniref:Glycosyl transferase n=2 Tax=Adhaeribacter aerolatus TaxID=670289 RepID=A0A512AWF5_9BACT|nr:glycosyl transferase [Adhaeribacter aerolatus]